MQSSFFSSFLFSLISKPLHFFTAPFLLKKVTKAFSSFSVLCAEPPDNIHKAIIVLTTIDSEWSGMLQELRPLSSLLFLSMETYFLDVLYHKLSTRSLPKLPDASICITQDLASFPDRLRYSLLLTTCGTKP